MLEPEVNEDVTCPADRGTVADSELLDDVEGVWGDGSALPKRVATLFPEHGQRALDQ